MHQPKRIYLVRHGQTAYNTKRIVQGRKINADLNENGQKQASLLFDAYKDFPFDKLYVTSLKRTHQTAQGFIDKGLPYEIMPEFDEMDYGEYEGNSIDDCVIDGMTVQGISDEWEKGNFDAFPKGGEHLMDVLRREAEGLEKIMTNENERNVMICMHSRSIRIFLCLLLDMDFDQMKNYAPKNTGVTTIEFNEYSGEFKLIEFNNIDHLGDDPQLTFLPKKKGDTPETVAEEKALEQSTEGFRKFKLNKQLYQVCEEMGYDQPTPIQDKAIPLVLAGHDLFGIAQTGTGKTAAYLLPLLFKAKYAQGNDPRVLILVPTRELAIQVGKEVEKLGKYTGLRHAVVYGGIGPKTQIEEIEKGIDILVGTPGRVMDIYSRGKLKTKSIKYMVLDEADRIMDMGFMPQIRQMLEIIPRKRQNLLFSATMPDIVVRLSEEFLEYPQRVEITPQATTAEMVDQYLYYLPNFKTKLNFLEYLLNEEDSELSRVIVFVKKKDHANGIFRYLERKIEGEVKVIHANKGQNARINSIQAFKEGGVRVLVATDVAARGIDVSMVSHVVNFDVPVMYDDYVHRVGRTGRANNTGVAITFCNDAEKYHLKKVQKLINKEIDVLDLPLDLEFEETPKDERQDMAREIDRQKKIEDPNYQGAFHEKKKNKDKVDKNRRLKNKSSMEKQRASGKISAYMGSGKKKK
ncbi:DEAD/DEAH box helicase [Flammeovirga yaeyamensis]|nr:DEAD/DEAH box helicase [Flammeovirga yaeyamensis]MBB3698760.1 superfamily II DNA/RNA helicase/broad specificity phosphatase PhoE [Flammeovirga yaeyamensis]